MKLFKIGLLGISLFVLINNGLTINVGIYEPSLEIIEPVYDNRSIAMGKTTTTTARGSSAIFSNPSILGNFSDAQIQVGGKIFYGTTMGEVPSGSVFDIGHRSRYPAHLTRSFFALALPYEYDNKLKLVLGIGYQRNEGVKQQNNSSGFRQVNITKGHLDTLTPGVAINLQDKYFLGATFNQVVGKVITTSDTQLGSYESLIESKQEQSAQFLRVGAFAKLNPQLVVGLMYRTEFEWILGEIVTTDDEDGTPKTERDQLHIERPMPTIWGIGAEYKVSPELSIALEVQSRPLSELQITIHGAELIIDDGFNISVGAEYLGFGLPFRVGAFQDVIPEVDYNDTAPRSLIGVTAGIGSNDDKNISWDASILLGKWKIQRLKGHQYSENLLRIGISGTYRFKG